MGEIYLEEPVVAFSGEVSPRRLILDDLVQLLRDDILVMIVYGHFLFLLSVLVMVSLR